MSLRSRGERPCCLQLLLTTAWLGGLGVHLPPSVALVLVVSDVCTWRSLIGIADIGIVVATLSHVFLRVLMTLRMLVQPENLAIDRFLINSDIS